MFVSLATGEVCVYSRDPSYGAWNTTEPSIITVGSAATPVTKMLPVHNRLWCTCHNLIKILNVTTLQIEVRYPKLKQRIIRQWNAFVIHSYVRICVNHMYEYVTIYVYPNYKFRYLYKKTRWGWDSNSRLLLIHNLGVPRIDKKRTNAFYTYFRNTIVLELNRDFFTKLVQVLLHKVHKSVLCWLCHKTFK